MRDFLGSSQVVRVNGFSRDRLAYALELFHGFPAHGYRVDEKLGAIVLMQYANNKDMIPFMTPLSASACADMIFEWVKNQPYPKEPDHDGSNKKGWIVWVDKFNRIDGQDYHAFVAIKPEWIMYGK
tara:strand:+ start:371 stop:748 length:378 start_codon:yes stop_codon:yes gene_type:complete